MCCGVDFRLRARHTPFHKKKSGEAGDVWTWTALDADTKLIVNWTVGDRSGATAMAAGITDELMDMSHIVKLIDDAEAALKNHGPYKKKAA